MLALNRFAYHKLIHFHEVDKDAHFAQWEQPELFTDAAPCIQIGAPIRRSYT